MGNRRIAGHRVFETGAAPSTRFASPMPSKRSDTVVDATVRGLTRAFRAIRVKMREAAAVNVLANLDPHTLKDIGIERGNIRKVAREIAENPELDYRDIRG